MLLFSLFLSTIFSSDAAVQIRKDMCQFYGLKQEQWCFLGFGTCLAIWKIYLAEPLSLSHSSSGFSGSFTVMRRKDIRLKKRNFICQSTPRYPVWRFYLAWGAVICLIGVNSCGDYTSSVPYGQWGQIGFTAVIFFITFCMLLFAIMAFKKAWSIMHSGN